MKGDDRVRFCRECKLNVFNLSALTRAEAEAFMAGAKGRVCGRFHRRKDGTVLTSDCPVGVREALRRRWLRIAAGALFAAVLSPAIGLIGAMAGRGPDPVANVREWLAPASPPPPMSGEVFMGRLVAPEPPEDPIELLMDENWP